MSDIFNLSGKIDTSRERKNRPRLTEILKETKDGISARENFRVEAVKNIRSIIEGQNFAGKEKIEVIPLKQDRGEISIQTKDASFSLSLIYDDDQETFDSLRKGIPHPPAVITLSAKVGEVYHTIADGAIEDLGLLAAELLKHIERKKYPERFGFENIQYIFENGEICIVGLKKGKPLKIPFLEEWNDEIRIGSYEFLASYFGKPIQLRQKENDPTRKSGYLET